MSKLFLKYESEHGNPLVDEHGVLKPSASGGYKYFVLSDGTLYGKDSYSGNISQDPVTKSEFEEAYTSQPIHLTTDDNDLCGYPIIGYCPGSREGQYCLSMVESAAVLSIMVQFD